jgi:hypothetical protein
MDVVKGAFPMSNSENTITIEVAPAAAPDASTKANVTPQARRVAPSKAGSKKKASAAKKAPKSQKSAAPAKKSAKQVKPKASGPRQGKQSEVLDMLRAEGGCTVNEIMKVTGWLPHTTRAFISAVVGKKLGLEVISTKPENGERRYSVKGA